jgi:hypothetical protein
MQTKMKQNRGSRLIAIAAVVAVLALLAGAGAVFGSESGFGFLPDASWAEGA